MHSCMQAPGIDQNGGVQRSYLDKPGNEERGNKRSFFLVITLKITIFDKGLVLDDLLHNAFKCMWKLFSKMCLCRC